MFGSFRGHPILDVQKNGHLPIRPDWELLLVLHEDMFDASVLVFPQESHHHVFFPVQLGFMDRLIGLMAIQTRRVA